MSTRSKLGIIFTLLSLLVWGMSGCLRAAEQSDNNDLSLNGAGNQVVSAATPAPSSDDAEFNKHFEKALTLANSDKAAAVAEMEQALRIHPDNKIALRWVADWYSSLGKPENEADAYRNWIRSDAKDMRAGGLLAALLIRQLKEYTEGLAEAQAARSLCVGSPCYVHDRLIGEAYEGLNDYPNAIKHYQLYLKGSASDGDHGLDTEISKKVAVMRSKAKHQ